MFGRPTLFRQTLLALIATLFAVHFVVGLAIMTIMPGDRDALLIGDVARQLAKPGCPGVSRLPNFQGRVTSRLQAEAPTRVRGMTTNADLAEQLAIAVGAPADDVRIFWWRGSEIRLNRPADVVIAGHRHRLDQTAFVAGATFARRVGSQWCVHKVAPPRSRADWRWAAAYLTLVSLLATLPLAWFFARRLSRPIREFADAADRIGRDSEAPPLAETGPDELRIASRALNEMQRGIQQQFRDREAMVAAIAHDLRTPLSRIAFRVEGLPAEVRDPVHRDIEQMKAMIKATIEYTRGLDTAKGDDPVDLADLLERLVVDEQALGAEIVLVAEAGTAVVSGNEIEFARLFQNLIDNARKFGGAVEVRLARRGDLAEVTVADRGPGIPAERREEMFTPFVRGEPSRNVETGGVGLGLPIARTIARRYGGDLELHARDGGGLVARVYVSLR
ncbi:MAG: ATP-binding protein [Novosphingobium sp.]